MSGPRTSQAGWSPCAALAGLGREVRVAVERSRARAAPRTAAAVARIGTPREPGASVRIVLSVM